MNINFDQNLSWIERLVLVLLQPFRRISLFNRLVHHLKLKSRQWLVIFPDEGGIEIRLPRTHWLDPFLNHRKKLIDREMTFSKRVDKEVLLRRVIHLMYQQGVISRDKHIVDIGAWLGDNTIIWSHFLNAPMAKVIAIDPAKDNIDFGRMLAAENSRKNIIWHQAVCAEKAGIPLYYRGKLNHARFNTSGEGKLSPIQSETIDGLVTAEEWPNIGLLHVDVEGFEKLVLLGSNQLIQSSEPVILFEQHITQEDPFEIGDWLKNFGYQLFMLNEVIPGCELDCRNFIAITEKRLVNFPEILSSELQTRHRLFPAVMGPSLIPLEN